MEAFTKLMRSITTSSIWDEDSDTCKVWVTMLAMADEDGFVATSLGGLARVARVTREKTQLALARFEAPDEDSRSVAEEGRRIRRVERGWQLINHGYFRDLWKKEERRKQWRESKARTKNAPVLPPQSSTPVNIDVESSSSASASSSESESDRRESVEREDPGRETMCPTDIAARAESLGVLAMLAEKLAVPIESIRHEAKDFQAYYTFGGGAGERRTGWVRQLRERIRKRHREGQLKPPGATEHDARKPNGEAPRADDAAFLLRARRGEYGKAIQGVAEHGERPTVLREMVRARAGRLKTKPADRETAGAAVSAVLNDIEPPELEIA